MFIIDKWDGYDQKNLEEERNLSEKLRGQIKIAKWDREAKWDKLSAILQHHSFAYYVMITITSNVLNTDFLFWRYWCEL